VNPKFTEQFLAAPFWERDERDLMEWFERPFVTELPDDWQVSAYDGRNWKSPSPYGSCTIDDGLHEALDLARQQLLRYWSHSDWRVEEIGSGLWAVVLRWQIPSRSCGSLMEVLYIASSWTQAHQRDQLLREIREQRMNDLDHLF
jgi:hypothetical protein